MARKFRLIYFICTNNQVFDAAYTFTNAYRLRKDAESVCRSKINQDRAEATMEWSKGKQTNSIKVEGFYLVHESLFDEILKQYVDEKPKLKLIKNDEND